MLAAVFGAGIVAASAQTTVKAVQWEANGSSDVKIVDVKMNPLGEISTKELKVVELENGQTYVQNTLFHDKQNELLYFFAENKVQQGGGGIIPVGGMQTMVVASAETGEKMRTLPFTNTNVMAPFFIGERNQLGFISSRTNSNGYGNNEDDISLVFFDMNTGEIAHKVELPSLSFNGLSAPVAGKGKSRDRFGRVVSVDASFSSPCYIASKNLLLFAAKDVTGTNRVFKVNANTGELESKLSVTVDILDMTYDMDKEVARILFVENGANGKMLKLGNMNINTNEILVSEVVRELTSSETMVADGYVELDADNGNIYVGKNLDSDQMIYTFNSDLELIKSEKLATGNEHIDIEFPTTFENAAYISLQNAIKMYPNPTAGNVTIATTEGVTVTQVRVMDNTGKVVKVVDVQSGSLMNDITVDNLVTGLYFVEIESDGAEVVNRKLIVK